MKLTKKRLNQIIAEEQVLLEGAPKTNEELLNMAMTKIYDAQQVAGHDDVKSLLEDAMSYIAVVQQKLVTKAIGGRVSERKPRRGEAQVWTAEDKAKRGY
jgi:hypothetical protein